MSKENLIKKFDKLFKTDFHKRNKEEFNQLANSKKRELGLSNLTSNNYLLILAYLYLESKEFNIDKSEKIDQKTKNVDSKLKKMFRNPLICNPIKNGILLVVTKKKSKEVAYVDPFKNVDEYKGSDIIYYNKKLRYITYTKGDADRKIKELMKTNKIFFIPPTPKEIDFSPIEKILTSNNKLDIFEVEFRSVNLEKIKGFYIKAGSKVQKINSKIKKIRDRLLDRKILRVINIKKIHLALKGASRDQSASLIITSPKKLGIFKIKWKGGAPVKLDNFIKNNILRGLFNVELVDREVSLTERILEYYLGKNISQEEFNMNKTKLESWDRYKILKYQDNKLKPNYANFENLLKDNLKKEYNISKIKINLSKKLIKKGYLLKRKKDSKEIFIYLNKGGLKQDVKKMLNKKLPVLITDFYENYTEEKNRYNFLIINEKGIQDFLNKIDQICSYPKFYENRYNNFINSKNQLQDIERTLNQIKSNQERGGKWEEICFDLLTLIFHRTFSLSGPSLPDGLTFWNETNNGFLWDSKALFTKKLKNSIKNKNKQPKDLAYVEVFRKKLQIDYYVFLTCGVDEANFNDAKKILEEYKKEVHFCCLTNNAILDLSNFFEDQDKASIFYKNLDKFCNNFRLILNQGYVDKIEFKDLTRGIENEFKINKKELRKEVKKEKF